MSDAKRTATLYVGIGNAFRSDDGVGLWVIEALARHGFRTHAHAGDGTGLLNLFEANDDLVLIDATRSGTAAGTPVTFDAAKQKIPADLFHYSTHRFGLAEAVETARALGTLPSRVMIHGIEGARLEAGTELSAPVREAASDLVETLVDAALPSADRPAEPVAAG